MYVCNCKGLRESQVRDAVQLGARRVSHVFHACGEKPQCARCVRRMAALIRAEQPQERRDRTELSA
ncbi:ferredoxin [Roseospira marina]|uniref:Ferredoxin n=1 Tax=Roseospira marina TaxID=140057 RepID=A0A5M6IFN0_9PROT|nr:ferredoxin [Roseospira marina]MBB4313857.1 bacterioferritin-associated ferredoxin [Roseospira marina]MBB5087019.1 bacterioferritin-associated ferredoxin [Roseospira marina]